MVPEDRKRKDDRSYSSITCRRTKDKWYEKTDKFMRHDQKRMLDYAERVYRLSLLLLQLLILVQLLP